MKNFGLSAFVLLALAVFSYGQTPTTWQGWRDLGFQQYDKKDYDGAIKSFSECIRLNSNATECYVYRGMLHRIKRNLELAIPDLTKSLELLPDNEEILITLAECYNDVKKYELALSTTTKGISLFTNPQNAKFLDQFYHVRALANFNLKKYKDTVADATNALNIGGKQIREDYGGQTYFIRALAYCQMGEFDLAVYDEKKAKELGYKINKPCNEADSLLAAGKPIDFAAVGKRAAAELHILKGLGALVDRKPDKAVIDFTKAIEMYSKSADAYYQRAKVYQNMFEMPSARADLIKALELNPNHEEALELKKQVEREMGIPSTNANSTVAKPAVNTQNNASNVLFFDDFDDNRNYWAIGNNDLAEASIMGGRKTMELKQQTHLKTILGMEKAPKIDQTRDFLIETQLTFHSGDNRHSFGMVWGAKDLQNVFEFGIYPMGKFYYGKSISGSWHPIVVDEPSPAIKTGIGAVNKLGVRKRSDKIEFYINDILVLTQKYESYSTPASIGFSLSQPKKISADYFRVIQY